MRSSERRCVVVVHHWDSRMAFERFWASPEYQPLKQLRHEACESDILAFDGLRNGPDDDRMPQRRGTVVAPALDLCWRP